VASAAKYCTPSKLSPGCVLRGAFVAHDGVRFHASPSDSLLPLLDPLHQSRRELLAVRYLLCVGDKFGVMDLFWIKSLVTLLNVSKERRADQVHMEMTTAVISAIAPSPEMMGLGVSAGAGLIQRAMWKRPILHFPQGSSLPKIRISRHCHALRFPYTLD